MMGVKELQDAVTDLSNERLVGELVRVVEFINWNHYEPSDDETAMGVFVHFKECRELLEAEILRRMKQ